MRRRIVAVAALGVITLVALAILSVVAFARVDSFQRIGDGRRLVVVAIHDQGEMILWSAVREQPDEVTAFVILYRPRGSRALLAFRSNIEVQLNAPLGQRPVVDGTGQRVPEVP
jgi:hypothetical protein